MCQEVLNSVRSFQRTIVVAIDATLLDHRTPFLMSLLLAIHIDPQCPHVFCGLVDLRLTLTVDRTRRGASSKPSRRMLGRFIVSVHLIPEIRTSLQNDSVVLHSVNTDSSGSLILESPDCVAGVWSASPSSIQSPICFPQEEAQEGSTCLLVALAQTRDISLQLP